MWRDPLDELIEELDQVTSPPSAGHSLPSMKDVIYFTDIILYGSPDAKRRLEHDPRFQEFKAKLGGRAKRID